jgi:hypothetical protein
MLMLPKLIDVHAEPQMYQAAVGLVSYRLK